MPKVKEVQQTENLQSWLIISFCKLCSPAHLPNLSPAVCVQSPPRVILSTTEYDSDTTDVEMCDDMSDKEYEADEEEDGQVGPVLLLIWQSSVIL